MPLHLAVGVNVQSGVVEFNGTKTMTITFPQVFDNHPSITLTLDDNPSATPPYRLNVSKSQFKIRFKSNHNGTVGWQAIG